MTGWLGFLPGLLLIFFSVQSHAQSTNHLPASGSDNTNTSTVYLDKESLGQYSLMVPEFLKELINTGKLPLYARPHPTASKDVEVDKGDREFSAQKLPSAEDFREMMRSAGPPFKLNDEMGADGSPFLWNYISAFWAYKRIELHFSIEDGDLPSLKNGPVANSIFRTNGTMERLNPMLGDNPKLAAQLFRERVTFKSKNDEPYNFLTIRFVTDFPDGIWVRSPVAPAPRRMYSANRDDSILGSALTLNDLLGYSGHFARGTVIVGPRKELLTPLIEGTTIETSVDDNCGRFKSKYRNASRSLPHLKGAAATLFSDTLFVPKMLQGVDVVYREPNSIVGRDRLWFDLERGIPVYRISFDHYGVKKHWVINVFEKGMAGSTELLLPRLSFIGDSRHDRMTLVRYTSGAFCKTLPTEPDILKGFDPSGI